MEHSRSASGYQADVSGSSSRGWLGRASWLTAGSAGSLGLSAIAGILLARFLAPSGFGTYAAVTVGTTLLSTLATYGLDLHLVTVLGDDATDREQYRAVLRLGLTLGCAVTAIGEVLATFAFSAPTRAALIIDLGEVAFAPLLLRAVVLQFRGQQRRIVGAQILNRMIWVLLVVCVVVLRPSHALSWLMGGRVAALCLQGYVLTVLARLSKEGSSRISYRHRWTTSLEILRSSAPIAFASVFGTGYNRLDQLILTAFRGSYTTGIYAAGVRLAELPSSVPSIIQNVSLPTLVRARKSGRDADMSRAINDALLLTIVPGGLAVALVAGLGKPLVVLVLGQHFAGATGIVIILAVADWARLPATVYTSVALAAGRRQILVAGTGYALALNIVVNITLIPFLGAPGAAIASVVAYGASGVIIGRGALRGITQSRLVYHLPIRLAVAASIAALIGHAGILNPAVRLPLPANCMLIVAAYVILICVALPAAERSRLIRFGRRRAPLAHGVK